MAVYRKLPALLSLSNVFPCWYSILRILVIVTVSGIILAMYAQSIRSTLGSGRVYIIPNGISEYFLSKHDGYNLRRGSDKLKTIYL